MKKCAFTTAVVCSFASTATTVQAQNAEDVIELDPIVVTAQHRDQLEVDVPISITVVPEEELNARQVTRLTDIVNDAPNTLATSQRGGNDATSITIRGVGTTAFGAGPSVAVYVDDVYVGADSGFNLSLPDLRQVEISRGPQGTLAGRSALAGSVALATNDPVLGLTYTGVKLGFGSNNLVTGELTQNLAISDNTALRFSILGARDDGWITNQQGGDDLDSEDTLAGRFKLLHKPTETWTLILSADYARDKGRTRALGPIDTVLDDGVNSAQPFEEEAENGGISWHNTWQTGIGQIESITAWRSSENKIEPGTLAPVAVDLGFGSRDYSQFTQEVRLTGASERLDWTLGAFFLKSDDDRQEGLGLAVDVPIAPGFVLPAGFEELSDSTTKTESFSIYADGTYALTNTLDLIGGLRLSYDRNEIDYDHSGNLGFTAFALDQTVSDSVTTKAATPRVGLQWAVTEQTNLYATISSAYKPAGFNIAFATTPDLQYDKETAINYEIGAKGSTFGGGLNYAFAAFYMDWRDQQVLTVDSNTGAIFISNAEKSRSYGVEFQADAQLATNTWVQLGLGYNRATFVDFSNSPTGDASGFKQPLAPEFSAGLGIEHLIPLDKGDLTLRGYYNWRSSFFFDASNLIRQPAYGLLDLSATFDTGAWTAALFVNNALDEEYLQAGGNAPAQGGLLGYPGQDRTIGIEFSTTF